MGLARVKVTKSQTLNMRNYESTKVEVGLELDCKNTPEAIGEAYEEASEFVEDKLEEKVNDIRL